MRQFARTPKEFVRAVVTGTAPVLAVSASILVMRAADLFPPELAWDDWPAWTILGALVFTFHSLLTAIAGRPARPPAPDAVGKT
ncbi:hypothetical protein HHL11_10475 [Ramlibacter sp. G-1-2-2]|uniref:Holin n=1 Tax=Ramlibacter agri TaxID=2728837 RepID=A0A848GZP7_9BURK|nr:hypothetical protein [Ramlibacter agri]NML44176.1 hypothetical protein [Ramlibacter agri]